jgi:hypothetical protein
MRKKTPLKKTLCLKFCAHYKPGKNEELACRGYNIVEKLILSGKVEESLQNSGASLDRVKAELLVQAMCPSCDFHEQDCDYFQDRAALPCGGFVLLSKLIAEDRITLEDVR